jgi:HSP20 family protein
VAIFRSPKRKRTRRGASLARWEPWRELAAMENQIENMFNTAFSRWYRPAKGHAGEGWSPEVDIYETDTNLVVSADIPGVDPDQITARLEGGMLYIKGQRQRDSKVSAKDYYLAEREYGPFSLCVELPATVDPETTSAEYRNGVLTVTVRLREEAKPKKIKIESQSQPAEGVRPAAA